MKFRWGQPPDDPAVDPHDGRWIRHDDALDLNRRSTMLRYSGISLGVLAAGHLLWEVLSPDPWGGDFITMFSPLKLTLCLLLTVVLHEAAHLVAQPSLGTSNRTIVGFLPKMLAPYAMYCGVMSRNRAVAMLLAPLLLLSLLPTAFVLIPGYGGGEVALVAIVNAAFSVVDVRNAFVLLRCIPERTVVSTCAGALWWMASDAVSD